MAFLEGDGIRIWHSVAREALLGRLVLSFVLYN